MSGIISYTALGGKSGVMGRIPSFKVTGADGTHNWEQAGRTWHASTVAWDTAGGVTRSRSAGDVQGSNTTTTYTAPITGLYQMNFNMNAGNNSNNTETKKNIEMQFDISVENCETYYSPRYGWTLRKN